MRLAIPAALALVAGLAAQTPSVAPGDVVPASRPGVVPPRVIREAKPQYTAEAMRNRVQGAVRLSAVVEADGTVSNVEVVKSLDPQFGLDASAVAALKQWTFMPGTLNGQPVRVRVTVDLTFVLRDNTEHG